MRRTDPTPAVRLTRPRRSNPLDFLGRSKPRQPTACPYPGPHTTMHTVPHQNRPTVRALVTNPTAPDPATRLLSPTLRYRRAFAALFRPLQNLPTDRPDRPKPRDYPDRASPGRRVQAASCPLWPTIPPGLRLPDPLDWSLLVISALAD
jgi:hypothetical protein